MPKYYTMWAEWDIGHEGYIFESVEDGKNFLQDVIDSGYLDPEDTVADLWGDLVGLTEVEVYKGYA